MGTGKQVFTRTTTWDLEPSVSDDLRVCEARIEGALDDAWHALRKIHDDKLYKVAGYASFEGYCEKRWGYSKSHAYRLIDHSKIVDQLKSEGVAFLPSGEGLTRPLQKLRRISKNEDEFLQRATEAWNIAKDTAPKVLDVPQVTVEHVESTMGQYGLYRNVKKNNPNADVEELRNALAKVSQCAALKMPAADFAAKFGAKAGPSKFHETLIWLTEYAEECGGEDEWA